MNYAYELGPWDLIQIQLRREFDYTSAPTSNARPGLVDACKPYNRKVVTFLFVSYTGNLNLSREDIASYQQCKLRDSRCMQILH